MTTWETETDDTDQTPEYQIKAHLVLEGSNQHDWGVVKDCHGCINYIPQDADIVGTWNKYGEGVFWVSIATSVQALVDKAVIVTTELARRRSEERARAITPKRAPSTSRVSKVDMGVDTDVDVAASEERKAAFGDLRKGLSS